MSKTNNNFGFLQVIFILLSRFYIPRYDVRIQMLKYQIKMLRDQIDEPRILTEEEERTELMRLGALIDHDISDVMLVVKPKTYRGWQRKKAGKKPKHKGGRPETEAGTIQLIIRLATENLGWGYKRIFGELKKLGIKATHLIRDRDTKFSYTFDDLWKAAGAVPKARAKSARTIT